MVILRTRKKITDFFMILAWASPFKLQCITLSLVNLALRRGKHIKLIIIEHKLFSFDAINSV